MTKPLIRWTIGDVHHLGFECLKVSVEKMRDVYGDIFDYVVCHNELGDGEKLKEIGVELYAQKQNCCGLPINPVKINAWKLFPPRLRMDSHEIFVDNDIVLHKKIEEIDQFLRSKKMILLEGGRSAPAYGRFENLVPKGLVGCSAIFGFPPSLDAEGELMKMLGGLEGELQIFDEQGLVSAMFASIGGLLIPKDKISNCWMDFRWGEYGMHFAGINLGRNRPWQKYKMKMGMYI